MNIRFITMAVYCTEMYKPPISRLREKGCGIKVTGQGVLIFTGCFGKSLPGAASDPLFKELCQVAPPHTGSRREGTR